MAWLIDFDRLRHDAVVGRNHKDGDIRSLSAAGAHGCKRSVAGRVDEGDLLTVLLDLIGADMLRDAASLAGNDLGVADGVEQRCLAVVDVAHDGHDRRTRLLVFRRIRKVEQAFLDIGLGNTLHRMTEFTGHQFCRVGVDHVAGLHDLALFHEIFHDIDGAIPVLFQESV